MGAIVSILAVFGFGYYTGSEIFVNQREHYKATVAAGLRYTLNHEK